MGQLGQLYYHYANIVMRLQWLCKQDDGGQPHERAIVDHACEFGRYLVHALTRRSFNSKLCSLSNASRRILVRAQQCFHNAVVRCCQSLPGELEDIAEQC